MNDPLWPAGVSRPTPVIALISVEDGEDFAAALADSTARNDDAYWRHFIALPFTWQRFTNWWVARRWVRPRDIRKG